MKAFDTKAEVRQIVISHAGDMVKLQKEQLFEGIGADGEYIRPFYSEDPYFKSAESAAKYARYKQKITPNPVRPIDVPNLFINGKYVHDTLLIRFSEDEFNLESDGSKGREILIKHRNAAGLGPVKRAYVANELVFPDFKKTFEDKTGFKL